MQISPLAELYTETLTFTSQALVAAQRAELQLQAKELEWHRKQTKAMAASQRDLHSVAVANATARFESILREQVLILVCIEVVAAAEGDWAKSHAHRFVPDG